MGRLSRHEYRGHAANQSGSSEEHTQPVFTTTPATDYTHHIQVQERQPQADPVVHERKAKRRWRRRAIGAITLLAVGAAGVGYVGATKRFDRKSEIAAAHDRQVSQVEAWQASGKHLPTIGGIVVIKPGSKVRSSILEANPNWNGYIQAPGNILQTVKPFERIIMTSPIIQAEGSYWVEATPQQSLKDIYATQQARKAAQKNGHMLRTRTAETLTDETIFMNLSGLLEQQKAVVCDQDTIPASYATITKNFDTVGPDKQPIATYIDDKDGSILNLLKTTGVIRNCLPEIK